MLEYRLEPEGGLLVCALGTLEVGGGQIEIGRAHV